MVHHTAQTVCQTQQRATRGELADPAGPFQGSAVDILIQMQLLHAEWFSVDAAEALQAGNEFALIGGDATDGGRMNMGCDGDFHTTRFLIRLAGASRCEAAASAQGACEEAPNGTSRLQAAKIDL